jgi:hypothetical protein
MPRKNAKVPMKGKMPMKQKDMMMPDMMGKPMKKAKKKGK